MPPETARGADRQNKPSLWLSLSGGGFRAALFHYGCLKRLRELGLLGHVFAISATSGGALIAALLAQHATSPVVDRERGTATYAYDWEGFERSFFSLVRRGIIAPTLFLVAAYSLYVVGASLFAVGAFQRAGRLSSLTTYGAIVVIVAAVTHLALAVHLLRAGAMRPTSEAISLSRLQPKLAGGWSKTSVRRLLGMLLVPSYLRWQTLNLRAFRGCLLVQLGNPRLYLTAVDLNSGKEIVFTQRVWSPLDALGCRQLWEQAVEQTHCSSEEIEVAQAVSASSAFPPLFRSVPIKTGHGLVGVFVDGGVLDNFAINVPRAFATYVHQNRERYSNGDTGIPPFKGFINRVLILDGGKKPTERDRIAWGRIASGLRLLNVLVDQQSDAAQLAAQDLTWNVGVPTELLGIRVGYPDGSVLRDAQLERDVARVRTHFDAFSNEECAVLAYCGYAWVTQLFAYEDLPSQYAGARFVPMQEFEKILPPYCGAWNASLSHLRKHLSASHWRLSFLRRLQRLL